MIRRVHLPHRRERPSPEPRTSVLLVDDHEVFRQGLRALLEGEPDLVVVGEAGDGREAIELARNLRPDVVVMDVAMPRLNGIEAARQILHLAPDTRIIMLSAHSDREYVAHAEEVGAAGFVLKQRSLEDLAAAIRAPQHASSAAPARPTLTGREAEVLQLIAESRCNKQIARELGISVKTVEKHRQSLMTKLDIHEVAGLTHYAMETGVVECGVGHEPF